jgi:hypothetical protein
MMLQPINRAAEVRDGINVGAFSSQYESQRGQPGFAVEPSPGNAGSSQEMSDRFQLISWYGVLSLLISFFFLFLVLILIRVNSRVFVAKKVLAFLCVLAAMTIMKSALRSPDWRHSFMFQHS